MALALRQTTSHGSSERAGSVPLHISKAQPRRTAPLDLSKAKRAGTPSSTSSGTSSTRSSSSGSLRYAGRGVTRASIVAQWKSQYPPWTTAWRPAPEELVCDWRAMSFKGHTVIARVLHDLEEGETNLYLADSHLFDSGALLLAEALRRNASLSGGVRSFNVTGNNITDIGGAALVTALLEHANLQAVCLANNECSDETAQRLCELIERRGTLRVLNLENNRFGDEAGAQLAAALVARGQTAEVSVTLLRNPCTRFRYAACENLGLFAGTARKMAGRSVTFAQLLRFYKDNVMAGNIVDVSTTTREVVFSSILPVTQRSSFAEVFCQGNALPRAYVIHAWDALFSELVYNVAVHATGSKQPVLDPDDISYILKKEPLRKTYFIDIFCVNQHSAIRPTRAYGISDVRPGYASGDITCQVDKLDIVATEMCRNGGELIVSVDARNHVLGRVSCLRELHAAIKSDLPVRMIAIGREQAPVLLKIEEARAGSAKDHQAAVAQIRAQPEGTTGFDRRLRDFLNAWAARERLAYVKRLGV
eukprot:TRINITY_DN23595_c0_g1_i1.p1 TRINITY_DN23595_c0_g1~~TRINITY_DN23595_c0_g1_i1.p1  ORF type:complete len:534 (+),score=105.30 TRINITY_DN23595_c0_g1_i1:80-1681(+)